MENFSRIDIFDTKGIEYLFVIGYLIILIVFWKVSGKQIKLKTQIRKALGNLSASVLKVPQGLFFNKHHTWAHLEASGVARVGLDDFLQHVTGEVSLTGLRGPDEEIRKGDILAEIQQDGKQLKVFSPLSGRIIGTNELLDEDPGMINTDPYEKGWICEIQPSQWKEETSSYYLAEEAVNWSRKELGRFRDFMAGGPMKKYSSEPSMLVLQDGGEIRDHILADLPGEVWSDFQQEFLDFQGEEE